MSEKYVSIEDINLDNPKAVLSSPRSLKACRQLGIVPSELFYIPFEQYKCLNPDMQSLPAELAEYRYDHYEKFRNESIQMVKLQREQIINQSSSLFNSTAKTADYGFQSSFDGIYDFIVADEKKQLEKLKLRQKLEMQSIIQNEMKLEAMTNQTIEREKRLREKELWDQYNRMLEDRRKDKELRKHLEYNQHVLDKKRRTEEMFYPSEKKADQKGALYRKPIDNYMDRRVIRAEARRAVQDQKEKERKDLLEKDKKEKLKSYERQRVDYDRRLCRTRTANDLNIKKIQRRIKEKQKVNEKKREECISIREISIKKRQHHEEEKFHNIILSLKKAQEEEEKKTQIYLEKKEKMDQIVIIRETSKRREMHNRSQSLNNLHLKTSEVRLEKEKEDKTKKLEICSKIDFIQKRYLDDSKAKEKELIYKKEDAFIKRFEKNQFILRMNRVKDYQSEDVGQEIKEKTKKIEDYKQNKISVIKRKVQMVQSLSSEKQELIEKYDEALYKTKKLDFKTIEKLYPDDKEFLMKIKELKGEKSQEKNTAKGVVMFNQTAYNYHRSSINEQSSQSNENKKKDETLERILAQENQEEYEREKEKLIKEENDRQQAERNRQMDKEIEKKVEEYHRQLLQELNLVIEEEKYQEEKRIKLFEQEQSLESKQALENKMSKERAEANKKVKSIQNQIGVKVKEYEQQLKAKVRV